MTFLEKNRSKYRPVDIIIHHYQQVLKVLLE